MIRDMNEQLVVSASVISFTTGTTSNRHTDGLEERGDKVTPCVSEVSSSVRTCVRERVGEKRQPSSSAAAAAAKKKLCVCCSLTHSHTGEEAALLICQGLG